MKKLILFSFFFTFYFSLFAFDCNAQWQPTNGPAGGYIRNFIFDSTHVYAATGSGVLVSGDDGSSWSFSDSGLISCDTKSFAKNGG